MIEYALSRTTLSIGWYGALQEQAAAQVTDPARWILASDFKGKNQAISGSVYGQHATIGFRGLQELSFSYTPFAEQPPTVPEAEASKFRIYAVRLPIALADALPYATIAVEGLWDDQAKQYILAIPPVPVSPDPKLPPPPDPWIKIRPIELTHQPAVIRIDGVGIHSVVDAKSLKKTRRNSNSIPGASKPDALSPSVVNLTKQPDRFVHATNSRWQEGLELDVKSACGDHCIGNIHGTIRDHI